MGNEERVIQYLKIIMGIAGLALLIRIWWIL